MKKKLLPIILVCCMLSAWLAAYAHADDIVDSGNCGANGDNVQWALDSNGHLTISGQGAMYNYGNSTTDNTSDGFSTAPPWRSNYNMIISLTVNEGVTSIGSSAFRGLNRLTQATLADSVLVIDAFAFSGCSNLLSFTIPDNVTAIGDYAFQDCDRLTEILIPHNVISVGEGAFRWCEMLRRVTMLADIPSIYRSMFESCELLREITIPDNVTIIGRDAFSGCSRLQDVYFTGAESLWNNVEMYTGNTPLESANIHYGTFVEASYSINSITISDGAGNPLTEIPNGTFWETLSITNRASGGTPIIFFAAYAANGQFLDCAYVTVKEPVGGTVEVTLPVDNSSGNITQLKAFAVRSFDGLEPIGNLVSFPAQ